MCFCDLLWFVTCFIINIVVRFVINELLKKKIYISYVTFEFYIKLREDKQSYFFKMYVYSVCHKQYIFLYNNKNKLLGYKKCILKHKKHNGKSNLDSVACKSICH